MYERKLLHMDFDQCVHFLTNLPATTDEAEALFVSVQHIQSAIGKLGGSKSFAVILDDVTNRHQGIQGGLLPKLIATQCTLSKVWLHGALVTHGTRRMHHLAMVICR